MIKLFLDIETSPHVAYTWGLFDTNISLNQIVETSRVLCVAYKFDDSPMQFAAEWQKGGHEIMIETVHAAINAADVVVHYNGASFDEKHLNREFLLHGLKPPAPYRRVDLYRTVHKNFRFASGKLEHVADQLGIREGKIKTDFSLWRGVMNGDPKAQAQMERYNKEDVALLQDLYEVLLPWIGDHPNVALMNGKQECCTRCGSTKVQRRGVAHLVTGSYQRFQCCECGGWFRSTHRMAATNVRSEV